MTRKTIAIPDYLPENQKKYLESLIKESQKNTEALFAVNAIIHIIKAVEFLHKGKGQEILKGAHIVIENPKVYQALINNTENRKRISSHYKGKKKEERGINLKTTADFLVGLNRNDKVWLQLEGHKVSFEDGLIRGAILLVLHMIDYLQYKFTGKNVGPCGLSEYVERDPIIVDCNSSKIHHVLEIGTLDNSFNSSKLKTKPFREKINQKTQRSRQFL